MDSSGDPVCYTWTAVVTLCATHGQQWWPCVLHMDNMQIISVERAWGHYSTHKHQVLIS